MTIKIILLMAIKVIYSINIDPSGYILYCPCMGRFGNQADHLLGSLSFSKALNRTLVVPPWIEYRKGDIKSVQIPFNTYFKETPLAKYHRILMMDDFIQNISQQVWPHNKRISFCYMERKSLISETKEKDCFAKDGNPFGPFWDTYKVDFVKSEFFGPLHYDVHYSNIAKQWLKTYPATKWPVLAFTGAPGSFPVQADNRQLQKYIEWNSDYKSRAQDFIKRILPKGAFVGIHLRNGIDWIKACEHVKNSQNLFASPQCLGYNNENGPIYMDLCLPPKEIIIRQIKRLIKRIKTINKENEIHSIFVASDNNHMIKDLNESLSRMKVTAHKLEFNNPHLDLAILGMSNYFIGNCVSSFSAFVKRERDVKGFPSYFWAFPKEKDHFATQFTHEEL